MTDRAKQAREVAQQMFNCIVLGGPGGFCACLDEDKAAVIIKHALIAEHNATVKACAQVAMNAVGARRREIAAEIRALLVKETVGEKR